MNIKITRNILKEWENNGAIIVKVPYCGMQYLCNKMDRIGENCGVYGWNYTVYNAGNNVLVVTGYRNLYGKTAANYSFYNAWMDAINKRWCDDKNYTMAQYNENVIDVLNAFTSEQIKEYK